MENGISEALCSMADACEKARSTLRFLSLSLNHVNHIYSRIGTLSLYTEESAEDITDFTSALRTQSLQAMTAVSSLYTAVQRLDKTLYSVAERLPTYALSVAVTDAFFSSLNRGKGSLLSEERKGIVLDELSLLDKSLQKILFEIQPVRDAGNNLDQLTASFDETYHSLCSEIHDNAVSHHTFQVLTKNSTSLLNISYYESLWEKADAVRQRLLDGLKYFDSVILDDIPSLLAKVQPQIDQFTLSADLNYTANTASSLAAVSLPSAQAVPLSPLAGIDPVPFEKADYSVKSVLHELNTYIHEASDLRNLLIQTDGILTDLNLSAANVTVCHDYYRTVLQTAYGVRDSISPDFVSLEDIIEFLEAHVNAYEDTAEDFNRIILSFQHKQESLRTILNSLPSQNNINKIEQLFLQLQDLDSNALGQDLSGIYTSLRSMNNAMNSVKLECMNDQGCLYSITRGCSTLDSMLYKCDEILQALNVTHALIQPTGKIVRYLSKNTDVDIRSIENSIKPAIIQSLSQIHPIDFLPLEVFRSHLKNYENQQVRFMAALSSLSPWKELEKQIEKAVIQSTYDSTH